MPEALQVRLNLVLDPMLLLPVILTEDGRARGPIGCHCNINTKIQIQFNGLNN